MVKCPECGTINPDSAKGCHHCGADLVKTSKKASKSNSNTIIIAVIVIVVVIAIVGIFASGMLSNNNNSADSTSQSVAPIVENNTSQVSSQQSSSSDSSTEYWASAKTGKFHLPTCEWGQKISDANKVVYHSRDDAIADGKEPCSVCNP